MRKSLLALLPFVIVVIAFGIVLPTASTAGVSVASQPVFQAHASIVVMQASSSTTNSTGINGTSIWSQLSSMAFGFLDTILKGIENVLSDIMSGIGTAFEEVFQGWGYTVTQQTGIFAPLVMIAILGMSFFVLQMFMALYAGEKDVEEEVEAA